MSGEQPADGPEGAFHQTGADPDPELAASIARVEDALQRFRDTNPIIDLRDGKPDLDFARRPLHDEGDSR